MSTRSLIGRENPDGSVDYIYCHFDGYLRGVGKKLMQHWTDPAKIDDLIALGNISGLGQEVGSQQDFNARPHHPTWTLAYGRDRGEENQEAIHVHCASAYVLAKADSWADYLYLFRNGQWMVYRDQNRNNQWQPVSEAIAIEASEDES